MTCDTMVIRTPCGLSGDMLLCGLAKLLGLDNSALAQHVRQIGLPALEESLRVQPRLIGGISGWTVRVTLPDEHAHRGLADIVAIIQASDLRSEAQTLARRTFERLADVEAEMHGITVDEVHFHEIGALDSILDVCMVSALYVEMGSPEVFCSALPVSDGVVRCAHGLLATPAPAVLRMLEGIPVYGVQDAGETVTPTALALLIEMGSRFGAWPALLIQRTTRAYGTRVFANLPNGAIFAFGHRIPRQDEQPCRPPRFGDEHPDKSSHQNLDHHELMKLMPS